MIGRYDIAWGLAGAALAPLLLLRGRSRQKVRRALRQRMGQVPERASTGPAILIHAVSLGEINATRALVDRLRADRPAVQFIISSTTETGFDRATALYAQYPDVTLIRYPLDFTAPVCRVLDRTRPDLVVLMELEVWPNFVIQCGKRGIPVLVINARLTSKSFRHYRLASFLTRSMFARLACVCAQDKLYADRFIAVGVPSGRVCITGTMKFDNAAVADTVAGSDELASALGLAGAKPIWVCGSTGPGEEAIVLEAYRELRKQFPTLRLVIVPRKPERFDEVAQLIASSGFPLVRRSQHVAPPAVGDPPVILGDTMGELRKFYALADVIFVGRTLVDLGPSQHGSDMMEPAALGKPIIVGPFTGNFADAMNRFTERDAMKVIAKPEDLRPAVQSLLTDPAATQSLSHRARQVVLENQGATERHARIILQMLEEKLAGHAGA